MKMNWIEKLKFNEQGLIPAIIQDYKDKKVLMLGYMNRQALELTVQTGRMHFYSRSRKKLWIKGESSGHIQKVKRIRIDCDQDTLLIEVEQKVAACHEGYRSCFFREISSDGEVEIVEEKVFEPKEVYRKD